MAPREMGATGAVSSPMNSLVDGADAITVVGALGAVVVGELSGFHLSADGFHAPPPGVGVVRVEALAQASKPRQTAVRKRNSSLSLIIVVFF